jgi:hypothetical protein
MRTVFRVVNWSINLKSPVITRSSEDHPLQSGRDNEQQNGGVSHYFCNQPIQQWNTVSSLARSMAYPIFCTS